MRRRRGGKEKQQVGHTIGATWIRAPRKGQEPGGEGGSKGTGRAGNGQAAGAAGLAGMLTGLGGALPLLGAGLAGSLMAVQGTLNSVLSKVIGLLETSFLAQLLGGAAAATLLYVLRLGSGSLTAVGRAPWYTLLAGPIGVAIIYGVAYGIGKVGVASATTAIIIGQVSTAVIIDSFGLFGARQVPFCWTKILGVGLLAAAGWIMLRK